MATKITTASTKSFAKIKSFLKREKVFFTSSLNNGVYTLFVFDLTNIETTTLINKMTQRLHFTNSRSLWLSLPERTSINRLIWRNSYGRETDYRTDATKKCRC